jgi:hypothetical protein
VSYDAETAERVRRLLSGRDDLSGFVCVDPGGYAADDELARWVQRGLTFATGLPAKPASTS